MNAHPPPREDRLRLLTPRQVARFLGTTVDAIYRMRARGHGPPGYRIGRHLRFRWADIRRWQQRQDDR